MGYNNIRSYHGDRYEPHHCDEVVKSVNQFATIADLQSSASHESVHKQNNNYKQFHCKHCICRLSNENSEIIDKTGWKCTEDSSYKTKDGIRYGESKGKTCRNTVHNADETVDTGMPPFSHSCHTIEVVGNYIPAFL